MPAPISSSRTSDSRVAFEDVADAADVRGERGERLLEALLVADVGEDVAEDGNCALAGRDVHAAQGHEREQAGRLEADRLAAGVGAGDDQDVEPDAEIQVDRHYRPRLGAGISAGGRDSRSGWPGVTAEHLVLDRPSVIGPAVRDGLIREHGF